jgi:methanogenic corrinoid protein MtbC1
VTDGASALCSYLRALDPPDLGGARRLVTTSLDDGMAVGRLIDEVLAPAQREVGRRWYANEWTVADEHAATAITDAVLAEASLRNVSPVTASRRSLSCCVEGEWHTIPARMLTDQLVADGQDVTFLGPSLSPAQLGGFLRDIRPIALLASCTVPVHLTGARRTIAAAHEAGVPVIIGGLALGLDGARAGALGADAWASSATEAAAVLATWAGQPPQLHTPHDVDREHAALELPSELLVDSCVRTLLEGKALDGLTDAQLARTREDVSVILQFCSAALLVNEPSLFHEFTRWLRGLLAVRGVPTATIQLSYRAIADTLGRSFPTTAAMLIEATTLL